MDENQVLSETPVNPVEQEQAEKMLTQSQVNKIVQREKENAASRARRETQEEHERQLAGMQQIGQQQDQRNNSVGRDVDANAIYQQVQERFNKEMQERQLNQEMSQIANNYLAKMNSAKGSYADFDEITASFDPSAFPQLVYLASGMENAGEIIYDLSKNPQKLVTLDTLAQKSPQLAKAELLKLSQSIANNQQAKGDAEGQNVNQPLDQLQPSRVSAGNGKKSISDLRNDPMLRG